MEKCKQLFLLLILLACFSLNGLAQGKRVTVDFKNTEVSKALRQVEEQSGMKIQFNYKDMNFRVTYAARNAEALKVVNDIVGPHGLQANSDGQYIRVSQVKKEYVQPSGRMRNVSGYVRDEAGDPLIGVPVCIGETRVCTVTDADGYYTFKIPVEKTVLKFSYVGLANEYAQIA